MDRPLKIQPITYKECMGKKQFFIVVDTETSITDKVADFGAVICDREGVVVAQCAVLVGGVYGVDKLFYNKDAADIWGLAGLQRRTEAYNTMLQQGSRMMASVAAINRWLDKAAATYSPELTAYNLAFDRSKCANTGIDLAMFPNRFCLWHAAVGNICQTKAYKRFILENHLFNAPTEHRNMTYSTTAESVAGFLGGTFQTEPHTALEDALEFEVPILKHILGKRKWRDKLTPYDWKKFQVKDHFST